MSELASEHLIIEADQNRLSGFDGGRPKVAGGTQHIGHGLAR